MLPWLDRLYSLGALLAAICVALTTFLVLAQIVGRLMGVLVPSVPEVAGFLLGATIFLALPATMRKGEQIRVDLLLTRLPFVPRLVAELGYRALGAVVTAYLSWELVFLTIDSWTFGDRSAGLVGIPIWIPQVAMTLGMMMLFLRFVEEGCLLLRDRAVALHELEDV